MNKTVLKDTPAGKWLKSIKDKGGRPEILILDEVDKNYLFWEQHYIDLYRTWGFNLTNCTIGGNNKSYGHSPKSIEKMRDIKLDKLGINKEEWVKNRKVNKERVRKSRVKKSLKPLIVMFDKATGLFVEEFTSSWEAAKSLGVSYKKIDRVLSTNPKEVRYKSYKGYIFKKKNTIMLQAVL
jgi:hypothetical protein